MPTMLAYILLFVVVGAGFILVNLLVGYLVRPVKPNPEKGTIYECGEPTVGTSWIQFDLRFYVVALLFVIFDVEMVFFFPWAVVYGKLNGLGNPALVGEPRTELAQSLIPGATEHTVVTAASANTMAWFAFCDILVFFGVILVGFAYLWRRGDLSWVRSLAAERGPSATAPPPEPVAAVTPTAPVGATA